METKKLVIATIVSLIITLTMFTAINPIQAAVNDPPAWYTVTNGVLDSDYYMMYPFEPNSVSYGFSKFGELLAIPPGADQSVQANWVGMMYDGRDPFAPLDTVPMTSWINGWYVTVEYTDPAVAGLAKDRHLFAFAMFADGYTAGGDWQIATEPSGAPHGGRKTNGLVTTENLKVLYDGPRKFVAQSVNHLFDKESVTTWPVVDLTITMIFDKVMKQTILYKDVKITIPKMHIWGKLNVELSNREEYDLGPSPGYASYAHFYEEQGITSYTPDWHLAQNLTRDHFEHQVGSGQQDFVLQVPNDLPLATDFIKVYVDGVFQDPSVSPAPYTINYGTKTVHFVTPVGTQSSHSDVKFFYKYIFKGPEMDGFDLAAERVPTWAHVYDYAQVISSDGLYVAWAAMWPPVSSYTVDGILRFLQPMYDIAEADMSSEPKQSPLIIGQWDFALDHATMPMFRGVEVKGIANAHNADDEQLGGYNVLDTEAYYQLDTVFYPFDLKSAVEKDTNRWVQFHTITEDDYEKVSILEQPFTIALDHAPVHWASTWEEYNDYGERVFMNGSLQYPTRQLYTIGHYDDYELSIDQTDGDGTIVFFAEDLVVGEVIKIVYSTDTWWSESGFSISDYELFNGTISQNLQRAFSFSAGDDWTDALDVSHDVYTEEFTGWFQNVSTMQFPNRPLTWTYDGTMEWEVNPFKVFKEDETGLEIGNDNFATVNVTAAENSSFALQMKLDYLEIVWDIMGPRGTLFTDLKDVHFYGWDFDVEYSVTVYYNNNTMNYTATGMIDFVTEEPYSYLYTEKIPGRYELFTVGRDAQSIDSAGVGEVTAAFKNKQVEIGIGSADMYNTDYRLQMPWIMSKFGTGNTVADYKDTISRAALKDDWCTTWQITSGNLIGEGGPAANVLTYYANDFTNAFAGLGQFTSYAPWVNKIIALSCWNGTKGGYSPSLTTGYAVISAYQDINGTNMFLVWGYDGRDTYYASQWFHEDLIREFQNFPDHATDIVLKITYKSYPEGYKPTAYSVVQVLGTISETLVYDSLLGVYKGGIHDP